MEPNVKFCEKSLLSYGTLTDYFPFLPLFPFADRSKVFGLFFT